MRRALVGLALALPACGLLTDDPGSEAVPSDGVGAFGPGGPIELCLGTARVVAPAAAAGAGAVCVEDGAAAKACSADAGCIGIERCVCGRCIVRACQGAASCSDGQVCRGKRCTTACAADADCASGERCISGGCARSCSSDAACHYGERCDSLDDVCVAELCSASAPCGGGDVCEPEEVVGEIHEPVFAPASLGDVAYVEIRSGASAAIHRARIDGPSRWVTDPLDPVVMPGPGERVGAPSVIERGGAVELYFAIDSGTGSAIARAVSTDGGRTFTRDAAPVLEPAEPWEAGWVGSPAAFEWQGDLHLAYEGGPRAGIGLARVGAAGAERLGGAPVISPASVEDPIFWRAVGEVSAPHALPVEGALRLYFTARGAEGSDAVGQEGALPADLNDSIGMAATTDLARFDLFPTGPVFARVTNLRAYLGEREASVRLAPEGAEIVFVAADASGNSVSGLGRAGPAAP